MYIKYIIKELVRRKSKTATIVLTVAIITAILFLFSSVMDAYSSGIYKPFEDTGSDMVLQKTDNSAIKLDSKIRMPFGKGLFDEDEIIKISALDNVQSVSGSLILWDFDKKGFVSIEGISPGSELFRIRESQIYTGRFLNEEDDNKAVVEKHFAKFNNWVVGSNISLGNEIFEVIGTLANDDNGQIFSSNVYINLNDANKFLGRDGFNQIYLKIDDLSNEESIKNEIIQLNNSITIISGNSLSASVSNVLNIFTKFYYIATGIIVLIVILVLLKVNTINLLERKRDIAVMRAVGWTKKDITKQIITELFIQTILGFFIGLIISFIAISFLGPMNIQISNAGLNDVAMTIPLTISLNVILQYFIMIIGVSVLVSFLLARKISEIKPSENLRSV